MLIHTNFRSYCLNTNTDVDIIIPDVPDNVDLKKFYKSKKKYKVLWLLHGSWGGYNDYLRRTNIDLYAQECGIMVVMPNALNSEYSNWKDYMLGYNMYDYFLDELMPMIYSYYPASNKKEDNYICGLSMGAVGAVKFSVNHPELFNGCSAMSGTPFNFYKHYKDNTLSKRQLKLIEVNGGIDKFLKSYENVWDKFKLVSTKKDSPKFLFTIGKDDFLYDSYKEFKRYAKTFNSNSTFKEYEGYGHEWRFWEKEIVESLKFFGLSKDKKVAKKNKQGKIDATSL